MASAPVSPLRQRMIEDIRLRGHMDEQVAGAAEDLLERMPWW